MLGRFRCQDGDSPPAACRYGVWLSLVERSVRDREVAGSNPVTPIFYCYEPDRFGDGNGRWGVCSPTAVFVIGPMRRQLQSEESRGLFELCWALRICKDRNVLKEYLESREKEVVDIMMTLFDDEQIYKAFENDIKQETAKNKAIFMIQKGKIAIDEVAEYFPELSEEERKEIESQVLQQA